MPRPARCCSGFPSAMPVRRSARIDSLVCAVGSSCASRAESTAVLRSTSPGLTPGASRATVRKIVALRFVNSAERGSSIARAPSGSQMIDRPRLSASTPQNRGGATPTMVNGWSIMRIVLPITSCDPPKFVIQRLCEITAMGAARLIESSGKPLPAANVTRSVRKKFAVVYEIVMLSAPPGEIDGKRRRFHAATSANTSRRSRRSRISG